MRGSRRERAIASIERDTAKKAQRRSEADFGLALEAVKRFYTEVSENKLLLVPTMDTVRIELLERAREFYERIARERPEDSSVQAELARTIWRLAVMVSGSRSVPEGIGLMEQSIAIQERLVHQYPDRAGISQRPGSELQQPGNHAPFEQSTRGGS